MNPDKNDLSKIEFPQFTPEMQRRSDLIVELIAFFEKSDDKKILAELTELLNNPNPTDKESILILGIALEHAKIRDTKKMTDDNIREMFSEWNSHEDSKAIMAKKWLDQFNDSEILDFAPEEAEYERFLTALQSSYTTSDPIWLVCFIGLMNTRTKFTGLQSLAYRANRVSLKNQLDEKFARFDDKVQAIVTRLGLHYNEIPSDLNRSEILYKASSEAELDNCKNENHWAAMQSKSFSQDIESSFGSDEKAIEAFYATEKLEQAIAPEDTRELDEVFGLHLYDLTDPDIPKA
jgi:hypothetical protein